MSGKKSAIQKRLDVLDKELHTMHIVRDVLVSLLSEKKAAPKRKKAIGGDAAS